MAERRAARSRHPTGAWRPDPEGLAVRLEHRLAADGVEHPRAASLALWARGRAGHDRRRWAELTGLSEDQIAAAEDGHTPLEELPPVLRPDLAASAPRPAPATPAMDPAAEPVWDMVLFRAAALATEAEPPPPDTTSGPD